MGKELLRSLQEVSNNTAAKPIIQELTSKNLYMKIASSKSEFLSAKHNPATIIMTQIPPFLEQYTIFIL
jgi:hypothetical protein